MFVGRLHHHHQRLWRPNHARRHPTQNRGRYYLWATRVGSRAGVEPAHLGCGQEHRGRDCPASGGHSVAPVRATAVGSAGERAPVGVRSACQFGHAEGFFAPAQDGVAVL